MTSQEEKLTNVSKLVKLLQSYSEAQEEDTQALKVQLKNLTFRMDEVVANQSLTNSQVWGGQQQIASRSPGRHSRSGGRSPQTIRKSNKGSLPTLNGGTMDQVAVDQRLAMLERTVSKLTQNNH